MDFFELFSFVVLPVAFLVTGYFRKKLIRVDQYWRSLYFWIAALILYYPISNLFMIGPYLSFLARPIGFVFGLFSLYKLCLSLVPEAGFFAEDRRNEQ